MLSNVMENEVTAFGFIVLSIAEIDEHRYQPSAMVNVGASRIANVTLMDVGSHPELVRLVFRFENMAPLLVLPRLPVRNIRSPIDVDRASRLARSRPEYDKAIVDKALAVSCLKDRLPSEISGDQILIRGIAPIERIAGRASTRRALRESPKELVVVVTPDEILDSDMLKRMALNDGDGQIQNRLCFYRSSIFPAESIDSSHESTSRICRSIIVPDPVFRGPGPARRRGTALYRDRFANPYFALSFLKRSTSSLVAAMHTPLTSGA